MNWIKKLVKKYEERKKKEIEKEKRRIIITKRGIRLESLVLRVSIIFVIVVLWWAIDAVYEISTQGNDYRIISEMLTIMSFGILVVNIARRFLKYKPMCSWAVFIFTILVSIAVIMVDLKISFLSDINLIRLSIVSFIVTVSSEGVDIWNDIRISYAEEEKRVGGDK